jgi:membrane-bound serine protease (ClpP class)
MVTAATTMTGFRQRVSTFATLTLIFCAMPQFVIAPGVQADDRPTTVKRTAVENGDALSEPRTRQSQWLDQVAEFFRQPIVNVALVALGLIGVIFEFKLPGTTLPGSVAAVCFVLFFWAHSFVGEFTLLAILLFLLGLIFLGIEVFVVPGLGFSGVAGAVLMFLSLLLVTLKHWPRDQEDWTNLGSTFGTLAIGLALAVAGALALTWSLPNIPLLNRMILKPPGEQEESTVPASLSRSGPVELLGAIGVAVTPLRPSGKAQFGEQFLDVIAEGDYVAPGARVQVIEIEGIRIVVKEV